MKHPMAEVPAASKFGADEADATPEPVTPPAPPAFGPASKDGQGTGGPAEVLGVGRPKIGNWPDPM